MGSPSLLVWQGPPKPLHSVFPATGNLGSMLPVDLSNTANDRLTHCTYWVRPTAPLVSGGMQHGLKPTGTPCPIPSKLSPIVGARGDAPAEVAAAPNGG